MIKLCTNLYDHFYEKWLYFKISKIIKKSHNSIDSKGILALQEWREVAKNL